MRNNEHLLRYWE